MYLPQDWSFSPLEKLRLSCSSLCHSSLLQESYARVSMPESSIILDVASSLVFRFTFLELRTLFLYSDLMQMSLSTLWYSLLGDRVHLV